MFDIVYIVSHGFASRMVTQTNLLGKLVQAGKSVALISPDKEDIVLKLLPIFLGVCALPFLNL